QVITLGSQEVLIPKLYLGKSKRSTRFSGIIGRNVQLSASKISNTSTIAGERVSLTARGGAIINKGGTIHADKELSLAAAGDIHNIGGIVSSGGSAKLAARNIYNTTVTTTYG
ncbi:MAG: hypothetical protein ACK58T_09960, partial [Phycisphaerae bacterium]